MASILRQSLKVNIILQEFHDLAVIHLKHVLRDSSSLDGQEASNGMVKRLAQHLLLDHWRLADKDRSSGTHIMLGQIRISVANLMHAGPCIEILAWRCSLLPVNDIGSCSWIVSMSRVSQQLCDYVFLLKDLSIQAVDLRRLIVDDNFLPDNLRLQAGDPSRLTVQPGWDGMRTYFFF